MTACFLVIDKPVGITSHDVVAVLRAVTGIKKVGHTGTLDPFATGVLPVAFGPATRLIQYLDESVKIYDMTLSLGTEMDTGDPTGEVVRTAPVPELERDAVLAVLEGFLGDQMQTPPAFSAVKKDGKPLYHYARKGETVTVDARPITINALELLELGEGMLRIRLTCSRGTYARVLANDIAEALGTVGHLVQLRRERSGPFVEAQAMSFQQVADLASGDPSLSWQQVLMARRFGHERVSWRHRDEVRQELLGSGLSTLQALNHLPIASVGEDQVRLVQTGSYTPEPPPGVDLGARYVAAHGKRLLALAERTPAGGRLVRVMPPA